MPLTLVSDAFGHECAIPVRYTCDGDNVAPPLRWSRVPAGTKSLALIVEDLDAPAPATPQRPFVHWVVYDLPPADTHIPEGKPPDSLPAGALEGINDFRRTGYSGPCPPPGSHHRYIHQLYALDTQLPDLSEPSRDELLDTMQSHILERGELIGTYQR